MGLNWDLRVKMPMKRNDGFPCQTCFKMYPQDIVTPTQRKNLEQLFQFWSFEMIINSFNLFTIVKAFKNPSSSGGQSTFCVRNAEAKSGKSEISAPKSSRIIPC